MFSSNTLLVVSDVNNPNSYRKRKLITPGAISALVAVSGLCIVLCTHKPDYLYTTQEAVTRYSERVTDIQQGASLEQVHETWRILMLIDGWAIGETYSVYSKTDPNLLPFDLLSKERKLMDSVLRDCLLHAKASNEVNVLNSTESKSVPINS